MKKLLIVMCLAFSSVSFAQISSIEEEIKCQDFSANFKTCQAGDKKCTRKNLALTEKLRVCSLGKYDVKAINNLDSEAEDYFAKIMDVQINTYTGIRKILNVSLMDYLKNAEIVEELDNKEKRALYKELKKTYVSIQSKLMYVDKTTDSKLLNLQIPNLKESNILGDEYFGDIQEDVNVLMNFFDIVYASYFSFETAHALVNELYPDGLDGKISYKRSGSGTYTDFECSVMDRLLNFMDDSLLEVLYKRACTASPKNVII